MKYYVNIIKKYNNVKLYVYKCGPFILTHCVNSRNSQFGNKIIVDIFTMSLLPLFLTLTSLLSILPLISGLLKTELRINYSNIAVGRAKMIFG